MDRRSEQVGAASDVLPLDHREPEGEPVSIRWRRATGLELLGPVQGSGLRSETYLVRRGDGQTVQVSALINLVLKELSDDREPTEIAAEVSRQYPRELTADGLRHLVATTLIRLGLAEAVIADAAPSAPVAAALPRATPLLSLTFRGTLLPASVTRRLGAALGLLFWPPLVWTGLACFLAVDVMIAVVAGRHALAVSITRVLMDPPQLLALYVTMTVATLVHELGHASACRYGGAQPGRVGVGVYIVFPAFYTDVSDSYRLNRTGRLRTDLGGLYFNVLTVLALGSCYLITGNGFFLLIVVLMQIEMAQQLIPVVRFDGYYILADLTGVPNLFAQIRPSLLSLRPGRVRESMDDLKPGARRLVKVWVFTVVPLLAISFGWLLWNLPVIITMTIGSLNNAINQAGDAIAKGQISPVIISVLSVVLLTLPLIGIGVLLWRLGAAVIRWLSRINFRIMTPPHRRRHRRSVRRPHRRHHRRLTC